MWRFVEPGLDPETREGLWHLDFVLERWAATPDQRRTWRRLAELLIGRLGERQAPALVPGLVQARVATALLLAGYPHPPLPAERILTVGAHAGFEVRLLRDWGSEATGIEQNPRVVQAGIEAGVVSSDALLSADAETHLAQALQKGCRYLLIAMLAPSDPAWPTWLDLASSLLTRGGHLVILAYWADLPADWRIAATPCLEGTMGGLLVRRVSPHRLLEPGEAAAPGAFVTDVTDGADGRPHPGVEVIGMVEVTRLRWEDHEWRAEVRLREGVYAQDRYRVVLTALGPIPADNPERSALEDALRATIQAVVIRQMRRGSLPPRAMVVNWRRLVDRAYRGDALDAVRPQMARLDASLALVSQADTRGYFHAMAPAHAETPAKAQGLPPSGPSHPMGVPAASGA